MHVNTGYINSTRGTSWWSLCALHLHACQVRVTVGDSGLWLRTQVFYSTKICRANLPVNGTSMLPNGKQGCIQRWLYWLWVDRSSMPVVVSPVIEHYQMKKRLGRVGVPQKVVWRKCAVILLGIDWKISRVWTVNTEVNMAVQCVQQDLLE